MLNALCDANGCVPGEPEVFELPTDSQGNELERQEFINFVRTAAAPCPAACSVPAAAPRGPSAVPLTACAVEHRAAKPWPRRPQAARSASALRAAERRPAPAFSTGASLSRTCSCTRGSSPSSRNSSTPRATACGSTVTTGCTWRRWRNRPAAAPTAANTRWACTKVSRRVSAATPCVFFRSFVEKRCADIPSETYTFIHGKPQVSFLVFTYALTASGGEKGGFAVVPGS